MASSRALRLDINLGVLSSPITILSTPETIPVIPLSSPRRFAPPTGPFSVPFGAPQVFVLAYRSEEIVANVVRGDELGIGLAATAISTKFGPSLLVEGYAVVVWLAKLVWLVSRCVWHSVPQMWREKLGGLARAGRDKFGAAVSWLAEALRLVFGWFLGPGEVRTHFAQGVDGVLWVVERALAAFVHGLANHVQVLNDLLRRMTDGTDAVHRVRAQVRNRGRPPAAVSLATSEGRGGGEMAAAGAAVVAWAAATVAEAGEVFAADSADATRTWERATGAAEAGRAGEAWEWAAAAAEEEAAGGW